MSAVIHCNGCLPFLAKLFVEDGSFLVLISPNIFFITLRIVFSGYPYLSKGPIYFVNLLTKRGVFSNPAGGHIFFKCSRVRRPVDEINTV